MSKQGRCSCEREKLNVLEAKKNYHEDSIGRLKIHKGSNARSTEGEVLIGKLRGEEDEEEKTEHRSEQKSDRKSEHSFKRVRRSESLRRNRSPRTILKGRPDAK